MNSKSTDPGCELSAGGGTQRPGTPPTTIPRLSSSSPAPDEAFPGLTMCPLVGCPATERPPRAHGPVNTVALGGETEARSPLPEVSP